MSDDLSNYDLASASEEGALLEVRNPKTNDVLRHEDGRSFTIKVVGKDSERFLKLMRTQNDRRIAAAMRTRTPAQSVTVDRDDIELLVNATLDWDIMIGGVKPPAEPNEFRKVYTGYRWLREQVDEFVGNRANFSKG